MRRKSHIAAISGTMENLSIDDRDELDLLTTELSLSISKGNLIFCITSSTAYGYEITKFLSKTFSIKELNIYERSFLMDQIGDQRLKDNEILVYMMPENPKKELLEELNGIWNRFYKIGGPSLVFVPQASVQKVASLAPEFWNHRGGFHEMKGRMGGDIFQEIVKVASGFSQKHNEELLKEERIYISLLKNINDERDRAYILKNIGGIRYQLGEYQQAFEIAKNIESIGLGDSISALGKEEFYKSGKKSASEKGRLTWIHLSDWHQKGKDFNRKVVRDALIKDIRKRTEICSKLSSIDFIVFSGDLSNSGSRDEFKAVFNQLFENILKASGNLSRDRLFVVPGNHDLDETEFKKLPEDLLQRFESEREIHEWLKDKKNIKEILKPFQAFSRSIYYYSKQKQPDYASVIRYDIDGIKIEFFGFNSALMCRRKDKIVDIKMEKGFLFIGEPQVYNLLEGCDNAEANVIKVAVLHHPLEWLAEFDRNHVENRLVKRCHFILCGHTHKAEVKQIKSTSGDYVQINTGAGYYKRDTEEYCCINSYNFVQLDVDAGCGMVFFRRWDDESGEWVEYTSKGDHGTFKFDLPKKHN